MAKLRRMLGSADSPYIISLMRLIETQSQDTIANWSIKYAQEHILHIYENVYGENLRLRNAINASHDYLEGKIKLPMAKKIIKEVQNVIKESEENPAAQAAVKAVGQALATIHRPTGALSLAFYGAAAIAYDSVGLEQSDEVYDKLASEICSKMEASLRSVAIENEENPAKINWNC